MITLKMIDLARGGAGVARDETGRVIFVPFTAPGDVVSVEIVETQKNYAQARLLEVIEPSPIRQEAPCPVFGRCGGCQWQHLPYDLQWKTKVAGVRHALQRVQVEAPEHWDEFPAERIWEYRNRVQLRGFRGEMGFFAAGSKELVATDRCHISRPEINEAWDRIRKKGALLDRPYKVELEVLPSGELRESWNSGHAAGGFRQVHDEQNAKLQKWVAEQLPEKHVLYDLFGGAGNLSLDLAPKMIEIHCVDLTVPRDPNPPRNYHFHRAGVAQWISRQAARPNSEVPAAAVLDPPRKGLAEEFPAIADGLARLQVTTLVAVGCDVDAWARDVSRFVRRGWRLVRCGVLDFFPQTPHVESMAVLSRHDTL